jgi:hypothetical protein
MVGVLDDNLFAPGQGNAEYTRGMDCLGQFQFQRLLLVLLRGECLPLNLQGLAVL